MSEKINLHLKDALTLPGAIIDFRIYDGTVFSSLITAAKEKNKKVYGLDTFVGLDNPNVHDLKNPNPIEIKKGKYYITPSNAIAFIGNIINQDTILLKTSHYNDLDVLLPKNEKYCFAVIDLKQFSPTMKALAYIWDKMSFGGTIYIVNYNDKLRHSDSYAIYDFISKHEGQLNISKQMIVEGKREQFIAIKCYNDNKVKPEPSKNPINPKSKITIAMVLKTGGDIYNYNYVNALAKSIKKYVTIDHEIVCLTDDATGFSNYVDRVIPLANGFPTWWNKIELFKPGQFNTERVFYIDLDTIIVDNIDDIVSYDGKFSGLRDFYALHSLGSGILAWNTQYTSHIYSKFLHISNHVIETYIHGDQQWIDETKPSIEYIQDLHPNNIVSFKRHCIKEADGSIFIPKNAKIICFHGNPRPHMVQHPSIIPYWQP